MKILYLSCHGILEYDELRMFSDMGIKIFSASGAYQTKNSDFSFRPKISNLNTDEEDLLEYNKSWYIWNFNQVAPKSFIDRFDVVYVMGMTQWLTHNWESFKHKPVIWRTIGQSNSSQELEMKRLKNNNSNFKIVRYSPTERNYNNYAGEDVVIRFGKRPDEWNNWNGEDKYLVTVVQSMKRRNTHCAWDLFEEMSRRVPCKLYGGDNPEVDKTLFHGSPTFEELKNVYRNHRTYFYAGTNPANYTLNFMEAWMTGIPIVALGRDLINYENKEIYEIPNLIENGKTGFIANTIPQLEFYTKCLFDNQDMANDISTNSRISAISYFDESKMIPCWEEFFKSL